MKYRQDLKITNTTPEMKKEYLTRIADKYMIVQAARNIKTNKQGQAIITLNIIRKKFASVQTIRQELNF